MFLVLSCSLNSNSRSRILGRSVFESIQRAEREVTWLDLQELNPPICDAGACYGDPAAQQLAQQVERSQGIILAVPIYNFDISAAAKNVIELTGKAWTNKVVGFVCAAGGEASYMSVMSVANSLMLDFRSFILPRFVFATGNAFDEDNALVDPDVQQRLVDLTDGLIRVTEALGGEGLI